MPRLRARQAKRWPHTSQLVTEGGFQVLAFLLCLKVVHLLLDQLGHLFVSAIIEHRPSFRQRLRGSLVLPVLGDQFFKTSPLLRKLL